MKAMVIREFGPPEVMRLEEVPTPVPEADEVLIEVRAVSVNRTLDLVLRAGAYAVGEAPARARRQSLGRRRGDRVRRERAQTRRSRRDAAVRAPAGRELVSGHTRPARLGRLRAVRESP